MKIDLSNNSLNMIQVIGLIGLGIGTIAGAWAQRRINEYRIQCWFERVMP